MAASKKSEPIQIAESRFKAILDAAVDGIVMIDKAGVINMFSPSCEKLFGYSASEVLGENVKILTPSPYREEHDGYLERYLATGQKKIIGIGREVIGRRKDGSTFPMQLSVGEFREEGSHGFVGIIHDLTNKKLYEAQMQELQSEFHHASRLNVMNQMASGLAHELNQPLTAVINYLEAAKSWIERGGEEAATKVSEYLDGAVSQTTRAGEIIRRLREFTEKGETERRIEDLNEVVGEACNLALVDVSNHGVFVTFDLAEDVPAALMDRIQVQQVITNLVRNAMEAMKGVENRTLTVGTAKVGTGFIEVSVSDTGPGLSEDVAENLFKPFTTTKSTGMGLGLSICRSIIEAHGGEIDVTPNQGAGVTFCFTLPTDLN